MSVGSAGLAFLPEGSAFVARRAGVAVARGAFLADVAACAAWLPDQPCIVNFCADRYRFTVLWAAAMLRGQVTLLPAEGSAAAVMALMADYPGLYVVTDGVAPAMPALPCPQFVLPDIWPASTPPHTLAFPPAQVAAVLFTSGSTGKPQPTARSWGRLVHASRAARAALGLARQGGASAAVPVVATVPHAHSYGLESAIMLPLQLGLLLDDLRPFYPADVAAALETGAAPGILVTTPVHLRALVQDATLPLRAGLVLSATAPLARDLAARAEAALSAPVYEIYGCSEAGQLATRRTTHHAGWRCLSGFRLRRDMAGVWACGPQEADALLADDIAFAADGSFELRGRNADLVNVAGKRSSLAYLTRHLTDIDGVTDGVFLQPDAVGGHPTDRLAALVVAPGRPAESIMEALRGRIDAAFLPRPLRVVDALPRNALGKLPRTEALRLLAAPPEPQPSPPAPPPPRSLRLPFAHDHPTAAGHFPGHPVIPGAVLIDALLPALAPDAAALDSIKFHHPVRPGETVSITVRSAGGSVRFEGRIEGSDRVVLSGAVRSSSLTR